MKIQKKAKLKEVAGQDGITPIKHGRSTNRASSKPPTYYVTIQENELLSNYDSFAMDNFRPTDGVNNRRDFPMAFKTTDPDRIMQFAKSVQRANPGKYIGVWRDRYAIGPQSKLGTNFARPGCLTTWIPSLKYWSRGLDARTFMMESGKKYSRRQIMEAIRYWRGVLRSMD